LGLHVEIFERRRVLSDPGSTRPKMCQTLDAR